MATMQTQPQPAAAPAHPLLPDDAAPDPTITTAAIRAEINRQNSLRSTGPSTPEGKDAVRLNALKSGIYAATVVLPHEDRAAYDSIGDDLIETYHPQTPREKSLVQAIQNAEWRMERVIQIETNLHLVAGAQQLSAVRNYFAPLEILDNLCLAQTMGYLENARTFDQLSRQESRFRRLGALLTQELRALIAARPAQRHAPAPSNGFVSQPVPKPAATPPPPPSPPAPAPDESGFVSPKPSALDGVPPHILERMPNFVGKSAETLQTQWLKKHWPKP